MGIRPVSHVGRTLLCGVASFLLALCAAADRVTYSWVDEDGTRHYSDRPPPEQYQATAEMLEVEFRRSENASDRDDPFATPEEEALDEDEEEGETDEPVRIALVRPQPEETFVNTGFRVQVSVNVQPRFPPRGSVVVYLDGSRAAVGGAGQQSFTLSPVYRGAHSVSAAILDENGRLLDATGNVTFYVRQTSAANPP